jgi:hypothetical protein
MNILTYNDYSTSMGVVCHGLLILQGVGLATVRQEYLSSVSSNILHPKETEISIKNAWLIGCIPRASYLWAWLFIYNIGC